MNKHLIRKYAKLIVQKGINIKNNQTVTISISIDQGEFAKYLAEECYKAGASRVDFEWTYQPLTKINYKYRTLESLSKIEDWQIEKMKLAVKEFPCRIVILSEDPNGLAGIDKQKLHQARINTYPIKKPYNDQLENRQQWCIAAVPSYDWAKKVFPNLSKSRAYEKLWEEILNCCRVTKDNDPLKEWDNHNKNFLERCYWLNSRKFDTLIYKSKNGTDFKVGLIPEAHWCGGGEYTIQGNYFNPNIPTEEIFTTPKKGMAEGKLVATKPLSYQGQLINEFYIVFKDGKAVEWDAKVGKDVLTNMLTLDEGASYLGEVALVPKNSPISNSNILFYETLFDENASCHVAVGAGFCDAIDGFENKTLEECQALGVNDSMSHVDFMIGSDDLTIIALKNGVETVIFKDGNWAFEPEI